MNDLTEILNRIKEKITNSSDMLWTSYETAEDLRLELDIYIKKIAKVDLSFLNDLNIHFLPASTFQEHSLQNNWIEEYLELSNKFDAIYNKLRK